METNHFDVENRSGAARERAESGDCSLLGESVDAVRLAIAAADSGYFSDKRNIIRLATREQRLRQLCAELIAEMRAGGRSVAARQYQARLNALFRERR